MRMALELAKEAGDGTRPNPRVGAILVKGGRCVGAGFHRGAGQPHAEAIALHQAGNRAKGADLYVGKAKIGNRVKIQNNVSVYDEVEIEDDVFCGPSMVFTNVYNPRATIPRKDEYRKTLVKKGATIGANATIICGVELGEYCFIGAGAVVNRDVKPYALMLGVPAKQVGWMSQFGERTPLAVTGAGEYVCKKTMTLYRLKGENLEAEKIVV